MEKEKKNTDTELLNKLPVNSTDNFFDFVVDLVKTTVYIVALALLLRYFVVQPYLVEGESMMPNFHNHEYLLAEKLSYEFGDPRRGDVVVFKYPRNPSVSYIKRVVGLPGETVKIQSNQIIVINSQNPEGKVLEEDYIPSSIKTSTYDSQGMEKELKDNEYFVLGDNREHSSDSREWGVLPKTNIQGRAWVTLFPIDRASLHNRIVYTLKSLQQKVSVLFGVNKI